PLALAHRASPRHLRRVVAGAGLGAQLRPAAFPGSSGSDRGSPAGGGLYAFRGTRRLSPAKDRGQAPRRAGTPRPHRSPHPAGRGTRAGLRSGGGEGEPGPVGGLTMSRQLCGPLGALLLCATPLTASADVAQADPWFGRDKALHFGVSVGLAATGYTAGALAFPDSKAAPWVTGAAFSLSLGLGKELVDHFRQGHFSV